MLKKLFADDGKIYLFIQDEKRLHANVMKGKGKRKIQGVPQSQTAALPRPKEEEETDKSKQAQIEQMYEKHKNKMTHGKTYNKSPRRINHKATKSKTNTGTTALEQSVE